MPMVHPPSSASVSLYATVPGVMTIIEPRTARMANVSRITRTMENDGISANPLAKWLGHKENSNY